MKLKSFLAVAFAAITSVTIPSCLSDGDDTIIVGDGTYENPLGIPDDSQAEAAPTVSTNTVTLPGSATEVLVQDGWAYMTITMNGIWDSANNEWLVLKGTGYADQNIWVSVDGTPKGIDVYNNSEDEGRVLAADVVFLVDNSGSMSEEANAIATSIVEWSQQLEASGLDIRVGVVGYGSSDNNKNAVTGAMDMSTIEDMETYLNHATGVDRTVGFSGDNATTLKTLSTGTKYYNGRKGEGAECGMIALYFAHDNFSFRSGANIVYVNFTDELNQPNGYSQWSVEYLNPDNGNWDSSDGTIHTIYSGSYTTTQSESPWLMSEYTGGTTLFASSSFTGITLLDLPVTGALQNSYVIRFTNIDQYMDGNSHLVKITVQNSDKSISSVKSFYATFTESN